MTRSDWPLIAFWLGASVACLAMWAGLIAFVVSRAT